MNYDEISILAGGWSARYFDVHRLPGVVIGVNSSAIYGRCDIALSMDRLWTEHFWDRLISMRIPTYLRRAALINIPPSWPGWVTRFECDHTSSEMTDDDGPNGELVLNGTNSGGCAVALAYRLRPRILRLYGLDGSIGPHGERHWHPDHPFPDKHGRPLKGTASGTFAQWQRDLDHALKQCRKIGIQVDVMKPKKKAA